MFSLCIAAIGSLITDRSGAMYRYTHSGHDTACLWLRSGKQDYAAKVSSFHMVSDPILLNFVLCSPDYLQIIGVCLALVLLGNGFGASLLHLHCTILNGSQFSLGYSRERLSVLASGVRKSSPWLDVFGQNAVAVCVQGLIHNLQW